MRTERTTIGRARFHRSRTTLPEGLLWRALRDRKGDQPRWRRQHPVGRYVLDFFCAPARLAAEIDGAAHSIAGRQQRDEMRDTWLQAQGIHVRRIPGADVLRDPVAVADGLSREAATFLAPSVGFAATSPARGGGTDEGGT